MSTVSIGNWKRGLHTNSLAKHKDMFDRLAAENNLDPTVLYAMANIESGFDAKTGNTNYGGLFAINKKQHAGKWTDPEYNTREAIKLYRQNERTWQKRFGNDDQFTPGKAYLLHQQGAGGGTALYANRNTNKSAAEVLAPFYKGAAAKTKMSPEDYVRKYVIKSNGANPNISARDFANMWMNRADALQNAYAGRDWQPNNTAQEVAVNSDPKPINRSTSSVMTANQEVKAVSNKTLWQRIKGIFQRA